MHISNLMERANEFDIIHNHYDFLPLTYSRLIKTPIVTTIHGFSSHKIIPVFKKYNCTSYYVSISNSDKNPELRYEATVYNGIDDKDFTYRKKPKEYLLFFGRIHPEKGTYESIQIAKATQRKLIISGLVQDHNYFKEKVEEYKLDAVFLESDSAVQSAIIPGVEHVKKVASQLARKGYEVKPILAPTVPKGSERLRFCLHSYNSEHQMAAVLNILATFATDNFKKDE